MDDATETDLATGLDHDAAARVTVARLRYDALRDKLEAEDRQAFDHADIERVRLVIGFVEKFAPTLDFRFGSEIGSEVNNPNDDEPEVAAAVRVAVLKGLAMVGRLADSLCDGPATDADPSDFGEA